MRIDLENKSQGRHGRERHIAIIGHSDGLVEVMLGNGSGQYASLMTVDEARIVAAAINREANIVERDKQST